MEKLAKEFNSDCKHDIKPSKIRGYGQCSKCATMFPEIKESN